MALTGSEGRLLRFQFGCEQTAGQKAATMYGLRVRNLKMKPDRPLTHSANNNNRGAKNKGRNVRVNLPVGFSVDGPDVDSIVRLLAHCRGFASIANPTTGVYAWTIRDYVKGTDSMASNMDALSFEAWRDDNVGQLDLYAVLPSRKIKIDDGKLIDLSFDGTACSETEMADSDMTTDGGTYNGLLLVRGNRLTDDSTNTHPITIKISTPGALDGTAKFKATKDPTAYGTAETAITANVWTRVVLADGMTDASGDPLEPMEVLFTTGTGDLSADDEWSIAMARPIFTPTYSSRNPLSAVGMAITVNGVSYVVKSAEIDFMRSVKEQRGGGSKFPQGQLAGGKEDEWAITFTRDSVDRVAWDLVKSGAPVVVDVKLYGDQIGSTAYREMWQLHIYQAQVSDALSDPDTAGTPDEKIVLVPSYDGTNPVCVETVNCTVATLI